MHYLTCILTRAGMNPKFHSVPISQTTYTKYRCNPVTDTTKSYLMTCTIYKAFHLQQPFNHSPQKIPGHLFLPYHTFTSQCPQRNPRLQALLYSGSTNVSVSSFRIIHISLCKKTISFLVSDIMCLIVSHIITTFLFFCI